MPDQPRITLLVTSEVTAIGFYPGYPEFLRSRGWDVTLIADSQGQLESSKALEGATTHAVSMRRNPSPLNDLRSLVELLKTLRRVSPDVLVFATPKASLLGAIAGFMLGVPVRSYQMWGLRLETERGITRKVLLGLEILTSLLATEVVANSRSLAAEAMRLRVTLGRQILVIGAGSGLGVDLEYYSTKAATSQLDPSTRKNFGDFRGFTIGFVGRIHPDKGIETLVRAASALSQQRPGVRILLVGAQDGTELNDIIRDVPESLVIDVVGSVSDVRPYYSLMDIHCLPTLREGFPNVVLEASAMGLPTVTTDATGAIDSVVDGQTGYIFPVGDWHALYHHMLRLYDQPGLRFEMGQSARRFVEDYYSRAVLWDLHECHLRSQYLAVQAARSTRGRKLSW